MVRTDINSVKPAWSILYVQLKASVNSLQRTYDRGRNTQHTYTHTHTHTHTHTLTHMHTQRDLFAPVANFPHIFRGAAKEL